VQSKTHGSSSSWSTGGEAEVEDGGGAADEAEGSPPRPPPMGGGAPKKEEVPHEPRSGFLELRNKKQPGRPMEQNNHVRRRGGGKHFTWEERVRLETLSRTLYPGKKTLNLSELARRLGRHRSSVSREYQRGTVINMNSELEQFPVYSARKGQDAADQAALNKGPQGKLTNRIAEAIRKQIIDEKLSPYAALVRLGKTGKYPWLPCERTVYYAIDAGLLGVSRQQLPYKPAEKRRRRCGQRMAYTNATGRCISQRPREADDRSEYGHWEMDTVVGGKGTSPACLLVMTERMSRREIIRKISERSQQAVTRALGRLEREQDNIFHTMKTITCDNGSEFLNAEAIEQSALSKQKRCEAFFAHPYTASERGSNENANRIIRRFIPKGADISRYTRAQIQKIEDWVNSLPRKLFDGLSADEKIQLYFQKEAA
jgi:transposase, IS30 family